MATTNTLQKLRRGTDASAYPPNGIRVTITAEIASATPGSQRNVTLADASNLPRGTDHDDPGIISVVQQGAEYNYIDTYYNWESIEDNVLINATCLTGAAVAAGSIGKVAADALYLEEVRAIIETIEAENSTQANRVSGATVGNVAVFDENGDLADSGAGVTQVGWERASQTRLDVDGTTLKVLPPEDFDCETGDTMPPLRPDGTSGYNAADPYIEFTLADGNIDGSAPSVNWENDFPLTAVNGTKSALAALFRHSSGAYKLKVGPVSESGYIFKGDNPAGTQGMGNGYLLLASIVTKNNKGSAVTPAGLYNIHVRGNTDPGATSSFRWWIVGTRPDGYPDMANVYGRYPANGSFVAVANSTEVTIVGGSLGSVVAIPDQAFFWVVQEAESNALRGSWYKNDSGHDEEEFPTGGSVTLDKYLSNNGGTTWDRAFSTTPCEYELTYELTAEQAYPDTPEGCELAALVGTPSAPVTDSTTGLIIRPYSELITDGYSPSGGECPVCMVPPPNSCGGGE